MQRRALRTTVTPPRSSDPALCARQVPSPNHGPRRGGALPDLIVLHYTAMADAAAACRWLCAPESEVSAHYLLDRDGAVTQLVAEEARAWHAGAGAWGGVSDVNSRSIGIELVNTGGEPFPHRQTEALTALISGIRTRWTIPPERVIGHSDMAPDRKVDPGRRFDWRALAARGHAIWCDLPNDADASAYGVAQVDEAVVEANLARLGYTAPVPVPLRLAAFRARFLPFLLAPAAGLSAPAAQNLPAAQPAQSAKSAPQAPVGVSTVEAAHLVALADRWPAART